MQDNSLFIAPTDPAEASPVPDTTGVTSPPAPAEAARRLETVDERAAVEGLVIDVIKQIYDPEIPVNIYELGLIYVIDVNEDASVNVKMTLTAPACPVAGTLPGQVETKIEEIPAVSKASVELVWEPPWCREMMSEAAQLQLGMM